MTCMNAVTIAVVTLLMFPATSSCIKITMDTFPPDLLTCLLERSNVTGQGDSSWSEESIFQECLEQFIWRSDRIKWENYNITKEHVAFVKSLTESILKDGHRRSKRQVGPMFPGRRFPQTGFRIRREMRRITPQEWMALHAALNAMKMNGQYDMFANMHSGVVVNSAHQGPNFFGWHRAYLSLFEEALRRINPRLSLPYWDSTLDFEMDDPVESILWTPQFLGNGDGVVTTGAFANWQTPAPLTRNTGGGSTLLSKPVIRVILSRCRTAEISFPDAQPQFNLELAHGGPHVWVGGHMSGLNTAAHDPIFFMHHAFIDYIWELFRIRQFSFCGVNPTQDYPMAPGNHAPDRPMDALPMYRNFEGYAEFWTRFWYNYERSPTCSRFQPNCGSPFLWCDMAKELCVSVPRMSPVSNAPAQNGAMGFAPAARVESANRGRIQAAVLNVGPVFLAPPAEPRTQDGQMQMASFRGKRAADFLQSEVGPFGPTFKAPPPDNRRKQQKQRQNNYYNSNFAALNDVSMRSQMMPTTNNVVIISMTIYYARPQQNRKLVAVDGHREILDGIRLNDKSSSFVSDASCMLNETHDEIRVYADGINNAVSSSESILINKQLTPSVTVVDISIKNTPRNDTPEMVISALDSCGRMCQALCSPETGGNYRPCPGVIQLISKNPVIIRAVEISGSNANLQGNIKLAFSCD